MQSKKNGSCEEIHRLIQVFIQTLDSANIVLKGPVGNQIGILPVIGRGTFTSFFIRTLQAILTDLNRMLADPDPQNPIQLEYRTQEPDSIDWLNALVEMSEDKAFAAILESGILDVLTAGRLFEQIDLDQPDSVDVQELTFKIRHADRIVRTGLHSIRQYLRLVNKRNRCQGGLSRFHPLLHRLCEPDNNYRLGKRRLSREMIDTLQERAMSYDLFATNRAFRYLNGEFFPAELQSIRSAKEFYGYLETRDRFRRFFNQFALGKSNHPMLITSLPGLGKTQFAIAFTLAQPNLTLILPQPQELENNLEILIQKLTLRKNRKFVIFFDDVDPRNINWYYFRTHVGGSFVLPTNVTIVIASNYEFPANISSRGQGLNFPMFDEITCQEMIKDFLMTFGMKNPPLELISVIASNYVEEFGQKIFEELSPRTLVRYLERYNHDQKKRKMMLDLARSDVISKPDPRIFLEVNVRLLRSLYGEEAIDRLRREKYDIYDDDQKDRT